MVSIMPNKEIKLKLTLNSIGEYDGGAEALLNDIKNAGVIIHRDDEGFLMTSDCVGKYSAYTESVSNLNELDYLVVYDVNDNEIGKLKIDFLELDDSLYNIPEGSTFEETELIIGFLEPETYTILFTNLTHPEFDIALPEPMTVVEGESVTLPSVSGEYEDTEYIYTPESWNIGAFESEITPTEDMTANLVWHSEAKIIEHTITFTNTTHPEFEVEFPESITVEDGESVSLPSVSGSFEDSGYEYTPLEWSIGAFGESFTPTEDVTANLLWKAEEIKPALPEVSSRNDFGDYNWLYVNTNLSYKTIQPNADEQLVFSISKSPAPYDSSKSYGVMIMQQYENGASGDSTLFSIINYSDTIGVKNISSNAVDAYAFRIAICSSSQAIIVVVYSSNNTAYNAFKYTLDGVDYYYVLDNIQTDWTDDLSSIGYTLTPVITLPTIWQSRANVSPSNQTIAVDGISLLSRDGQVITYYSDYSYAFRRWVKFTTTDRSPGEIISNAGYLAVKNTGTSDVTGVYNVDYAACSSNQSEVVTVYNANNEAYNAFKFTSNGADYYYVLDEVQTDWVNDLSSIGYSLTITMPTVSVSGDFGTNNLLSCTSGSGSGAFVYIAPNATTQPYIYGTSNRPVYNSNKAYATIYALDDDDNRIPSINVGYVNNGSSNLLVKNLGSSTILYNSSKVAVCSTSSADIITVYNSSNETFNAFKYTVGGVDYYYVLDNVQTDWVDDLSSIGYSLTIQLPTVFPQNKYYFNSTGSGNYYFDINQVKNMLTSSGYKMSYQGEEYTYALNVCKDVSGATQIRTGIPVVNNDGFLAIRNDTGSSVNLSYALIGYCASTQATAITVYNSNNNYAYNAFKYTINETDYYYVLDEIQTAWVTDLSSIGYSLTQSLPTITKDSAYSTPSSGSIGIPAGSSGTLYTHSNPTSVLYDSNNSYSVYGYYVSSFNGGSGWTYGNFFEAQADIYGTSLSAKNITDSTISNIELYRYAVCPNNNAEVVIVYNSSNIEYQAFKYTLDGTDYYYVLDGTQTDWTNDLSSIGYKLIYQAFLDSGDKVVQWNCWTWLYTNRIKSATVPYDENKIYTFIAAYKVNGDKVGLTDHMSQIVLGRPDDTYTDLLIKDGYSSFTAHKITYKMEVKLPYVDITDTFGSSNWIKTSIQNEKVIVQSGQSVNLYSSSGNLISYDTTKSYAVIGWQSDAGFYNGMSEFSLTNESNELIAINNTDDTLEVKQIRIAVCSTKDVTVIKVYNKTTGETFNAFKFVSSGINNYFILDGIQTDWATDLNSIGYSLIQTINVKPTVKTGNTFPYNKVNNSVSSNDEITIYADSNTKSSIPELTYYDTGLTNTPYYIEWTTNYRIRSISQIWGISFKSTTIESSTKRVLSVVNTSNETLQFSGESIALTNNIAIVVKVYNINSKVFFDAYKCTIKGANNNTNNYADYYYVLDGTHSSWVENLVSIGYVQGQTIKLYFNQNNINSDFGLNENNWMFYVFNGINAQQTTQFSGGTSSTQWEILGLYNANGEKLDSSEDYIWWINSANIYYKSVSSRGLQAQYVILRII